MPEEGARSGRGVKEGRGSDRSASEVVRLALYRSLAALRTTHAMQCLLPVASMSLCS